MTNALAHKLIHSFTHRTHTHLLLHTKMFKFSLKTFILAIVLAGAVPVVYGQNQAQNGDNLWSLQECIDYALANNLTVKRSELQFSADRAIAFQSKAALLPTVNASGNYAFNSGRSLDPTVQQFVTENVQTSNISLNGSLLLFQGGQQLRTIQQSQATAEASQYDLQQSRYTASLNTAQNYLLVLNNQ